MPVDRHFLLPGLTVDMNAAAIQILSEALKLVSTALQVKGVEYARNATLRRLEVLNS